MQTRQWKKIQVLLACLVLWSASICGYSWQDPCIVLGVLAWNTNQVLLTWTGESGVAYVIESSPDLQNWAPVATNRDVAITRTVLFSAPADASFYRVARGPLPLFAGAVVARTNIDVNGNNFTSDSYDSADPNHSINGLYNLVTRMANGDIASLYGIINVGNGHIYGHLYTGPNGSDAIGLNGTVGDLNWVGPGVEPGYYNNDFNSCLPDVQPPYVNGLAPPPETTNTYVLGNPAFPGSSYSYYWNTSLSLGSGETLYIAPSNNVTLYLTGSFTMQSQISSYLSLGAGASLKLYVGTTSGSATSIILTQVNNTGDDSKLQIFGLPSTKSISWNGIASFSGVVYAPEAAFSMGGGGSSTFNFQGACTVGSMKLNGAFNIHYDQNLQRGPMR